MRKLVIMLFTLLFAASLSAQQPDTSRFSALGLKLAEYYDALSHEPLDVQKQECDFLIESASDSLLRQYIANDIYKHYKDSPVMGAENIAVYVFDRWFNTGKIGMYGECLEAQVYADFNRQSLIGMPAPHLRLETRDGYEYELYGEGDGAGRYRVLYFYDVHCSKCKLESMLISRLFASRDYPVEFYAIYAGDNRRQWESYIDEHLTVTDAQHLWDPELESDFQRKYGVTQTPRIFLVGPDKVIRGRGLDAAALEVLLDDIFAEKKLVYGSSESEMLYDGIFAMSEGSSAVEEVKGISDYIHDKTLSAGDTLMFRQMAGDYLYYLATRPGEGFKEGLRYHIDSKILQTEHIWTSQDDTLKVIGFARIMDDLLSKSAPGTVIASVKVPVERYTWRRSRNVKVRLDRMRGKRNILIFYTQGCEVCEAEKKAASALLASAKDKTEVYMVNVDRIMSSDPALADRLMDMFDLSSLPYITMTDSRGKILRRYMTLQ